MPEKTITMQLAEYAAADHYDSFSEEDITMTKLAYLDWIGAAYTGVGERSAQIMLQYGEAEGITGDCVIIGRDKKTSAANAALINGTESHAIDFDDIHDYLSLHLCSPVMPAALAAAEKTGADGRRLINAAVSGMQIMVALSAGIMPEHYNIGRWHATGTIGIFGACAAAGYLFGLTPDEMCNAFGIAAGLCSGIQLNFGTMAKPLAAGMASKNGLMAAELAKQGFTGKTDIFDRDFLKNIACKEVDAQLIIDRLNNIRRTVPAEAVTAENASSATAPSGNAGSDAGNAGSSAGNTGSNAGKQGENKNNAALSADGQGIEKLRLGIHELRFKRYPCGAPTHSGIINCRKILEEHPHAVEDIEKIVFEPYPRAIRLVGNMDPKTGLEGKFSIGFTAAAQIVFGAVTIETFTTENVMHPQVQYLLPRMELVGNDEFTYSRGGRATMYFKDGTSYTNTTYLLGHELDLDEAAADVYGKFDEIMVSRAGEEKAETIRKTVMQMETLDNAVLLGDLL